MHSYRIRENSRILFRYYYISYIKQNTTVQTAANATTIPLIIVHECGYIVHYKFGINKNGGKDKKLFADFVTGAFLFIHL
jgi:hypothetical protein